MALKTLTNFAQSTLAADLTAVATELTVDDASSYPTSGYVVVFEDSTPVTDAANPAFSLKREVIAYTGRDLGMNKLTGLTRGAQGTTATAFLNSDITTYRVWRTLTKGDWDDLATEFSGHNSRITVLESNTVVRNTTGGDDTAALQLLIDNLAAAGGGKIILGTGFHNHTGLTGRAKISLVGQNRAATILNHTPTSGNVITLEANPDKFTLSDMIVRSGGNSSGWGLDSTALISRDVVVERCDFNNVQRGIKLSPDNLNCSIRDCRFNGPGRLVAGSNAILMGTAAEGGNGVTVDSVYISSYEVGIDTHAVMCYLPRVMVESCEFGIRTHAATTFILGSWEGSDISENTWDIDVQGNGILILGYGSSFFNIRFVDDSARNRSIIVPERFDREPSGSGEVEGVGFGRTIIRNYGSYNVVSLGRDDRIVFRTESAAKGNDVGIEVRQGAGAPSHTAPDGSLYLRNDPADQNSVIYVRYAGGWYPK